MIADLNPYPEYTDSGMPWIGTVPAHWRSVPLRQFAQFRSGGTPSKLVDAYWRGTIPWLSPKDFGGASISDTRDHITAQAVASSNTSIRSAGEVFIVARSGILKHTIPVSISRVSMAINQDIKAVSVDAAQCVSDFLLRWIQGNNNVLLKLWIKRGTTVESLEHRYVTSTLVPLPPSTNKPPSSASSTGPPAASTAPSAPSARSSPSSANRSRPSSTAPSPAASTPLCPW